MHQKINITETFDEVVNPGDVHPYRHTDGTLKLIICCPKCGEVSGSAGSHVYDPVTKTVTPSIVHPSCGAHYHIIDGEIRHC